MEVNNDFEDEELRDDEEEILVYVEFPNCVESNMFSNERLKLDMIGIDTESPIMQINGKFYEGIYEDAVGTYMFFEKDNTASVDDPVFQVAPTLKYLTKSRKVLKMQRVFVAPRTEVLGDSVHLESNPNINTIVEAGVPVRYQEEALAFWENTRVERIDALNAYLEKQRIRKEKRSQGISPVSDSDEDNPFMLRCQQDIEGDDMFGFDDENFSDCNTEMNEFERFLRNTAEKPLENDQDNAEAGNSQLEPEPSTSRETKPFLVPGKNIVKNKGVVKVVKTTRRKNNFKFQKNIKKKSVFKQNSGMEPVTDDTVQDSNEEDVPPVEMSLPVYENFQSLTEPVNESEIEESEFITDEIEIDQKPRYVLKSEYSSTYKRLQKNAKREAKMREISEQLKRMGGGITVDDKKGGEEEEEEGEEEEELII